MISPVQGDNVNGWFVWVYWGEVIISFMTRNGKGMLQDPRGVIISRPSPLIYALDMSKVTKETLYPTSSAKIDYVHCNKNYPHDSMKNRLFPVTCSLFLHLIISHTPLSYQIMHVHEACFRYHFINQIQAIPGYERPIYLQPVVTNDLYTDCYVKNSTYTKWSVIRSRQCLEARINTFILFLERLKIRCTI